jgi:16S rRNA (uracil1498-N3)-methyltransferase
MGKVESFITGSDAHHLRDVLRLQAKDQIVVFDGSGLEYRAQVVSVSSQKVRIEILGQLKRETEAALDLTIAQGYLKDKKMDGLVRQLTELGVVRWVPFLSRRSVPEPDQQRLHRRYRRWRKISLEALKQCGRNRTMAIESVVSFADALHIGASYDTKIIFWEESKHNKTMNQVVPTRPSSIFIMIGPEGGFEKDEILMARKEGFALMGLGPRILKAETAALAAAVMAQFVFGDMGQNVLDNTIGVL